MLEIARSELATVSFVQQPQIEQARPLVIPFKEFRKMPVDEALRLPPGTLIEGAKPNELFTMQDWLDPEKARRAPECFINGRCLDEPIGYANAMGGRPILLVGDGVHRSGFALVNGMKVDIKLELPRMPIKPDAKVTRLSSLVGRNPAIARMWGE